MCMRLHKLRNGAAQLIATLRQGDVVMKLCWTILIGLVALVFLSTSAYAQTENTGSLEIVVNEDGSLSFFSGAGSPSLEQQAFVEFMDSDIPRILNTEGGDLNAYEIMTLDNKSLGYYVTTGQGVYSKEPVIAAMHEGLSAKLVESTAVAGIFHDAYTLSKGTTGVQGVWLPISNAGVEATVYNVIPMDWSMTRTPNIISSISSSRVPIPEKEFTAKIRESLLRQAMGIACDASIVPKVVSASISVRASASFIVGTEGTVSFSATWDTSELCK